MPRRRVPTEATLKARAERAARLAANAKAAQITPDESTASKRVKLAQQIVEAHHDYAGLPGANHPDVRELANGHRRFPTAELYVMRDRAVKLRDILDRRRPDRVRNPVPRFDFEPERPQDPPPRFFKGVDIRSIRKAKDFMHTLDQIGPIPREYVNENLLMQLTQDGWVFFESTPGDLQTFVVIGTGMRRQWDPPLYMRSKAERKGTIYE